MALIHGLHQRNIRGDLLGGLTAAVVALPLALAFGNAALGPGGAIYGLYGAIVTGFLAALLGGTPAQVSGPTGPMSVTVAGIVSSLAAIGIGRDLNAGEMLPLVMAAVVIGGVFETLLGVLRLGRFITLVPYSVVSGFMSGIGFIILVLQLGPFIGVSTGGGVVASLSSLIEAPSWNPAALAVGLMTLAVVFLTPLRIRQWVPTPLLALLIVTPLSLLLFNDNRLLELGLEPIARIGAIPEGGLQLVVPDFSQHLPELVKAGMVLALLGAIDSLLTSLVADNITRTQHRSDRELIGQGLGNMAAALVGGLPGAGATMRTVTNVQAGGRTPLSGMVHSLALLIVTLGAGPFAAGIPLAVLGGILLHVGLEIVDWSFLKRAPRLSWKATGLMWLVLLLTVFWDLVTAVVIGVSLANVITIKDQADALQKSSQRIAGGDGDPNALKLAGEEQALLREAGGELALLNLAGPLSFGASRYLTQLLQESAAYATLVLDLTAVSHLGVTASLAIDAVCRDATRQGRRVILAVPQERYRERLGRLAITRFIGVEICLTRLEALQCARSHQLAARSEQAS